MPTLEQLKREIARLKAQREVREDFAVRNAEKRMLKKQLFALKNPTLIKSASRGLAIGKSGLSAIVSAAKKYHAYQQAKNKPRRRR
jgi:hypothetical protein